MIVKPEPLTYDSTKNMITLLRNEYDFAGFEVIGRSWAGKAVFSMSIGDGSENVLFLGGMRGKEQMTTLLLLRFFEKMCDAYKNDKKISAVKIRKSLQNRKITIVPLVSPDALDIASKRADGAGVYAGLVARAAKGDYSKWNANARGVDISRNFNFRHNEIIYDDLSFSSPSPQFYAGPSPESEPETKAISNLCENELFRYAFCFSVGGERIYWSERYDNLSETAMMAKVLSSVSGYPLCRKEEKERLGTFCEWFNEKHRRPAFEVSLGNRENIPLEDFDFLYNRLEEMLTLGAIM
ncbi:MAG: hypothetical protein MR019_06510 [Ruminococcus sp.]|nr:hypothetical protein [Ruminococcus sp.]MDY3896093.1 M14 family zinc carboxypeptidase [Candidatus Fimenecus sp.]